jgi:hypothetical protein
MVRQCYWAFLGFLVAVFFNLFGSLVALCAMGQASGRLPAFFLAAVYASAGIPGAWILWCVLQSFAPLSALHGHPGC